MSAIPKVPADQPDMHGYVIGGVETLLIEHLSMFSMTNHRYQQVLQVDVPDWVLSQYRKAVSQSPKTTTFVLGNIESDLFTLPDIKTLRRHAFIADIFQGIPTDPTKDKPLVHAVPVTIRDVIYHRPFDDAEAKPKELTYTIYGLGGEAAISHYVSSKPDFQHVVLLDSVPDWIPQPALEAGTRITIPALGEGLFDRPPFVDGTELSVRFQNHTELLKLRVGCTKYFDAVSINS
jgi:hypothetical protein